MNGNYLTLIFVTYPFIIACTIKRTRRNLVKYVKWSVPNFKRITYASAFPGVSNPLLRQVAQCIKSPFTLYNINSFESRISQFQCSVWQHCSLTSVNETSTTSCSFTFNPIIWDKIKFIINSINIIQLLWSSNYSPFASIDRGIFQLVARIRLVNP